jgi:hypothetical protein
MRVKSLQGIILFQQQVCWMGRSAHLFSAPDETATGHASSLTPERRRTNFQLSHKEWGIVRPSLDVMLQQSEGSLLCFVSDTSSPEKLGESIRIFPLRVVFTLVPEQADKGPPT